MSIASGTRLGPYQIGRPIGAGGMGEVYEARDTRLDREVAIKVLPEHLSNDATLRERFEREARAVSRLSHPHICTLHDVGEHRGVHFLVMELLEGETLQDHLKHGALPLERALELTRQMAGALAAAHEAGVVHRDLKPGNIMLTRAGVKLLDFGLAKTREEELAAAPRGDSEPATRQKPLTGSGTILGTIQYMAPEQLEGKEVDARADLFSLGAILFEMVTGRRAFEGDSQASLISAILSAEPPPVSELEALSPPALDAVVRSCLAKDPAERWRSAHDLAEQLAWSGSFPGPREVSGSGSRLRLAAGIAAIAAAAVAIGILLGRGTNAPTTAPGVEPHYLDVRLPLTDRLSVSMGRPGVALSPDGSLLAYVASRDGGPAQVFLRHLNGFEATPIVGTEGALHPIFAPDGESLAFVSRLGIKSVSLRGGSSIRLAPFDGFTFAGLDWLPDGDLLLGSWNHPLQRVSSTDGSITAFTSSGSERGQAWPSILPGRKSMLFTAFEEGGMENGSIVVESLESHERRVLLRGVFARYISSGHLIYVRELGVVSAVPFDLETLTVTGPAVPVLSDVQVSRAWAPDLAVSDRGDLVYVTGSAFVARTLTIGERRQVGVDAYNSVRASRRGDRLVLGMSRELPEIWIFDLERDTMTRLETHGQDAHAPIWSPDGRVVFAQNRDGWHNLFSMAADGGGELVRLTTSPNQQFPGSLSPDGEFLAFTQGEGDARTRGVHILSLDDPSGVQPFLNTDANEYAPMFSPDGKWLAYVSDESGEPAVYVRPFPGPGPSTRISAPGGSEPIWSPDGRELYYLTLDGTITSVELHYDGALRAGASRVRRTGAVVSPGIEETAYDVMPDGSLVMIGESESAAVDIHFVTNWFEELRRLAPTEK